MKLYFCLTKQLILFRQLYHVFLCFGQTIVLGELGGYSVYLFSKRSAFSSICKILKLHYFFQYKQLVELSCVDFPSLSVSKTRFKLVYCLLSPLYSSRICLAQFTDEYTSVLSVTNHFFGASWLEREVWDMFGIIFNNHTDLRRILTDYGFLGHPLRKDFPLSGFMEVAFNDLVQLVTYQKVSLAQEFRDFTLLSNPWRNLK